jgi:hypothetical protein
MKVFKENPNKTILVAVMKARSFLHIHGFITEKENDKIFSRTRKFQDKHKIEVTKRDLGH